MVMELILLKSLRNKRYMAIQAEYIQHLTIGNRNVQNERCDTVSE